MNVNREVLEALDKARRDARTTAGWRTAGSGDVRGFPDCVLVRPADGDQRGRIIFAELKSEPGRTTPEQQAWMAAILGANGEGYVWRPSDLEDIERVLA